MPTWRNKVILLKLPCCVKLAFHIISWGRCTVKQPSWVHNFKKTKQYCRMDCVALQSGIFVVTVTETSNLNFKTNLIAHRYTIQLLLRIDVGCLAHKTRSQHSYPSEYRHFSASLNGVTSQTSECLTQLHKYSITSPIRINCDGQPSGYAENPDNWIFLWK